MREVLVDSVARSKGYHYLGLRRVFSLHKLTTEGPLSTKEFQTFSNPETSRHISIKWPDTGSLVTVRSGIFLLAAIFRPSMDSTQPIELVVWGSFSSGEKQPEHVADFYFHSVIWNAWRFTSTPPFCFHYMMLGAGVAFLIAVKLNDNFSSLHWFPFCFKFGKEYSRQRGTCQEVIVWLTALFLFAPVLWHRADWFVGADISMEEGQNKVPLRLYSEHFKTMPWWWRQYFSPKRWCPLGVGVGQSV
jgi:hypothetical protein